MIRLMPARLTPSSWESRCTSRSSATSRGLYRRPPPGVRPGLTSPSRSYWRSVWACMPASSAATEMTKTGASSGSGALWSSYALTPSSLQHRGGLGPPLRSPGVPRPDGGRDLRPRVLVHRDGQLLQQLSLLRREPSGHGDVDGDQQVAAGALARDPAAADAEGPAARRAGRHLQRHRPVERGHGQRGPQRCLAERDGHGQRQVVALAAEQFVLGDVDDDEQVPRRTAPPAGGALARQPDPLAVLDAGRDPHGDRAGLRGDPVAGAGGAGIVDDLAGAPAVAARLGERERALAAAGHTGALADRAGVRAGARSSAVAVAGRAGARALPAQRDGHAEDRLVEGERRLGLDVLPARRPGRRRP